MTRGISVMLKRKTMPSDLRTQRDLERKEKTRQNLMKASLQVFTRQGYHNTLISDIVADAGVGQGTFYRYFTDKRAIFEAMMESFIEALFDEFSEMSANMPDSIEAYRDESIDALSRAAKIVDQHKEVFLLFQKEAPTIDREMSETMDMIYDRFAELARHYLDHAIKMGFARPCRSDIVAQSIVGIGLRIIDIWWRRPFEDTSIEELIRESVDFSFVGLAGPEYSASLDNKEDGEPGA